MIQDLIKYISSYTTLKNECTSNERTALLEGIEKKFRECVLEIVNQKEGKAVFKYETIFHIPVKNSPEPSTIPNFPQTIRTDSLEYFASLIVAPIVYEYMALIENKLWEIKLYYNTPDELMKFHNFFPYITNHKINE